MQKQAVEVAALYDQLNQSERGISWTDSDYVAGLQGNAWGLSKIQMARDGLRAMDDPEAKFEHELNDILWSVLLLATRNNIDLDTSFPSVMEELSTKLKAQIDEGKTS